MEVKLFLSTVQTKKIFQFHKFPHSIYEWCHLSKGLPAGVITGSITVPLRSKYTLLISMGLVQ